MSEIIHVNGKAIEVQHLGSGSWTRAYKVPNKKTVYLLSKFNDPMKDAISGIYHPHLPVVKRLSDNTYRTIYTETLNQYDHPEQYAKFKTLIELWRKSYEMGSTYREYMYNFVELARPVLSESEFEALSILLNIACQYGSEYDTFFDLQPVNFGVDHKGRLVFRDIIADPTTIDDEYYENNSYSWYPESEEEEEPSTPKYQKALNPDQLSLGLS